MEKSINYFEQYDKHLVIFDFDETICRTNAKVKVENILRDSVIEMSPTEYSSWRSKKVYEKNPSEWKMDFSEFQGYPANGTPNEKVINHLRHYASNDQYIVALVTGRDNLKGPKQFMQEFYVPINKMLLMCSGDPNKRNCFRSLLNTFEPKHVTIYEDSIEYIHQCQEICCDNDVIFSGVLVVDGELKYDWSKYEKNR